MPKKSETQEQSTTEKLFPFSVIIDGQDRTLMARDEKHLVEVIAKVRSPKSSPPPLE